MTSEAILAHLQPAEADSDGVAGRLRAARGALVGVLLGGALWIVILALVLPRLI